MGESSVIDSLYLYSLWLHLWDLMFSLTPMYFSTPIKLQHLCLPSWYVSWNQGLCISNGHLIFLNVNWISLQSDVVSSLNDFYFKCWIHEGLKLVSKSSLKSPEGKKHASLDVSLSDFKRLTLKFIDHLNIHHLKPSMKFLNKWYWVLVKYLHNNCTSTTGGYAR